MDDSCVVQITSSRIDKGLLAIPREHATRLFPPNKELLNMLMGSDGVPLKLRFVPAAGTTKEARLYRLQEWYSREGIRSGDMIEIVLLNREQRLYRLYRYAGSVAQQREEGAFAPACLEDARKRILAAIVLRQGQEVFREQLLAAYRQSCAVTGCDVVEVLEAAHIVAYRGPETNHVTNGLLLRADIHTLFDLGLLAVHPTDYRLLVSRRLRGTAYEVLDGQIIRLPANHAEHPSREALELHMAAFQAKESGSGSA
jgi:predicted restriction endonuclease